jgi:formate hydrogenlyase subunit 3/multisubunit Na+/H+ antiporter MnhD subunit
MQNMNEIAGIITLPVAAGLLLLILPEKIRTVKGIIALAVCIITGYLSLLIYRSGSQEVVVSEIPGLGFLRSADSFMTFGSDNLSKLIILFISLFAILILIYSLVYIRGNRVRHYYPYYLITIACSYGAVLSDSLILFLTFWGILGVTLYKMIPGRDEESSATAKKTLIMIGASDTVMIIGIGIIWKLCGSFNMSSISLPVKDLVSTAAFLALLAGSFTKAGAFPLHTWVPDYTRDAPASSSALLPASLDKLLGIYLLARITTKLFILNDAMTFILLLLGTITIITAVMMALVQHNYKRLLGFHAISQVGYMILGLGLGSLIGIAAGLFHMVNNTLYKSGLFLSAGCLEYRTGKENIEDLGGLSKAMPVTFISSLIFAISISGIPPFNGFASKWLIYQGIIDFGSGTGLSNKLWVLWLGLAVLGSALTLASFIKFIGGVFLSRRRESMKEVREVPAYMWIPVIILALFCIFFGVFATGIVIPGLFVPVTGKFAFAGYWNSSTVSLLVLVSIVLGSFFYLATGLKKFRTADSFIGGEKIQESTGYPTTEFYKTIGEFRFTSWFYKKAEEKWFDIYDVSKQIVLRLSHSLSGAHSGVLPGYVLWVFAGLIIMLLIMI